MSWTFPDAPSVLAQRIPTGVIPNLYLNVTMSETNDGTQQDSAYAAVTGLAKVGTLFSATSGPAPYTG